MHPKWHIVAMVASTLVLDGCTNPLSFGPGRIKVELAGVSVERVLDETLRGPEQFSRWRLQEHEALVIRFNTSTDLFAYFKAWQRMIQVRCLVEGSEDGDRYDGAIFGPYEQGIDISRLSQAHADSAPPPSGPTGLHEYSVYAFPDLWASDEEYKDGQPVSHLHLDAQAWSRLTCYVIGVTKAPVLFPRSNDIVVTAERFQDAVKAESW